LATAKNSSNTPIVDFDDFDLIDMTVGVSPGHPQARTGVVVLIQTYELHHWQTVTMLVLDRQRLALLDSFRGQQMRTPPADERPPHQCKVTPAMPTRDMSPDSPSRYGHGGWIPPRGRLNH